MKSFTDLPGKGSNKTVPGPTPAGGASPVPTAVWYEEWWVRIVGALVASHFVEMLGREESIFYLLLQRFYYIDLFSGAIIALAVWETIRRVTLYLDQRYAWESRFSRRAFLQGLWGFFVPLLLLHLLTYVQFTYLIGQRMEDTTWFTYELPVCAVILLLLNTYYLTYYFFCRYHQIRQAIPVAPAALPTALVSPTSRPSEQSRRQVFILQKGARSIPVRVEDIAYIHKIQEYNYLYTFGQEKYLLDESLDDVYAALDEKAFFRANRQTIISFKACQYYLALDYGKLEVFLQPQPEEPVIISQKRGPLFKEWMQR